MKITTKTNPVTLTVLLFEIMGNKTAYQAFLEHYSENDFWNETTKDFCEQVKPHRANYDAKRESIREAFFPRANTLLRSIPNQWKDLPLSPPRRRF